MSHDRTAGLIEASTSGWQQPLTPAGSISVIQRIVLPLQQAGIFPIVVLTGTQERAVQDRLGDAGVIFLHCQAGEPIQAVRQGLAYLENKCARVVYAPANTPFFTADTVLRLMEVQAPAVVPTHEGQAGHPILLSRSAFPAVLAYEGGEGLRGALRSLELRRLEVADAGVRKSVRDAGALAENVRSHNATLVQPMVSLTIGREEPFYDRRVRLLLYLLSDTCNLRQACGLMHLSVGKAWDLLNRLERELGYPVVQRRQGGRGGGKTTLTPRGSAFLEAAEQLEGEVRGAAGESFYRLFQERGIL